MALLSAYIHFFPQLSLLRRAGHQRAIIGMQTADGQGEEQHEKRLCWIDWLFLARRIYVVDTARSKQAYSRLHFSLVLAQQTWDMASGDSSNQRNHVVPFFSFFLK